MLLLPKLLIAGGVSFLGTLQQPASVDTMNHTLAGDKIPSSEVVCRNCWGTPMLPNGKAGYSVIAPIKKSLIEQSLWIPPVKNQRPEKDAKALAPVVLSLPVETPAAK